MASLYELKMELMDNWGVEIDTPWEEAVEAAIENRLTEAGIERDTSVITSENDMDIPNKVYEDILRDLLVKPGQWEDYEPDRTVEEYIEEYGVTRGKEEEAAQEAAKWWEGEGYDYRAAYQTYLEALTQFFYDTEE